MEKFRIQVPGNFDEQMYGQNYYAVKNKDKSLSIVGIEGPERITKQYDFLFDEESSKKYGIDHLPRIYEVEEDE